MPGRPSLPSPVPPSPPREPTTCPAGDWAGDSAAELLAFNRLLVSLLVGWVERAREHQSTRREAGLPAIDVSWENDVVEQYAARLGDEGAEIAMALIQGSRPALPEPPGNPAEG